MQDLDNVRSVEPTTTADERADAAEYECILCGGTTREWTVEGQDFEYACKPGPFHFARCTQCGHVSIDPMPSLAEIGSLYPPTYFSMLTNSPLFHNRPQDQPRYLEFIDRQAEMILEQVKGGTIASVLEVGCGDALNLCTLAKKLGGVPALGVDLQFSEPVRQRAAAGGVRLLEANIENLGGQDIQGQHDLIVMMRNLEHLRDPVEVVRWLGRKLTPGGRLIMYTPNLAGLDYRLFGRHWGGYHFPRHLHLFTRESLTRLAGLTDLEVDGQGSVPSPHLWIISLRNALGLNSAKASKSVWEFLKVSSAPLRMGFVLLDLLAISLKRETSSQYIVLRRRTAGAHQS